MNVTAVLDYAEKEAAPEVKAYNLQVIFVPTLTYAHEGRRLTERLRSWVPALPSNPSGGAGFFIFLRGKDVWST